MTLSKKEENRTLTVHLEGELNTLTAPDLQKDLRDVLPRIDHLILDFSRLSYISSAGLRVILTAWQALESRGSVTIRGARNEIREIFQITGLDELIAFE